MLEYISAFLLGVLSILSPCSFVIIPVIASDMQERVSRLLGFLAGIVLTFLIFGFIASTSGVLLTTVLGGWLYVIAGTIALAAGLQMFNVFNLHLPTFQGSPKTSFAKGMVFGGVVLTCATPLLAGVLTLVVSKANFLAGMSLMFVFALGFVTPFVLFSFLITDKEVGKKLTKWAHFIRYIGATMLVGVSLYLYYFALRGVL